MKKLGMAVMLGALVIGLLCAGATAADGWTPRTGMLNNMVAFGTVAVTDVDYSTGECVLYGFGPGGDSDCRFKSEVGKDGSFYATIVGSAPSEAVTFVLVDGATGDIYRLDTVVLFEADTTLENMLVK